MTSIDGYPRERVSSSRRAPEGSGWLRSMPLWAQAIFATLAAFLTYFCMYAFRKPFAAGSYASAAPLLGLQVKTAFVIAQIVGYMISKYLGARILPELSRSRRLPLLVLLIGGAWLFLVAFGLLGPVGRLLCLFGNGLCLGMIWGLVVSFLEGRTTSEVLLAGLSCSFIVSSAAVKDVGRWLMSSFSVSEAWMPALTGALFVPLLAGSTWMLSQIPSPSPQDEDRRSARGFMGAEERRRFVTSYRVPLGLMLVAYLFLTAYRDYRDNYAVELFAELGVGGGGALLSQAELVVAFGVMLTLALLSLVKDNRHALSLVFLVMVGGVLLVGAASWLLRMGVVGGFGWMVLVGLGSYLTYVPFGSVVFDRILAHTRATGTAVFGIYLADAVGYTGSVGVQVYADVFSPTSTRLEFFLNFSQFLALGGALLLSASLYFWLRRVSAPDSVDGVTRVGH